ncbi:hypothetical protein CkaCkLH20_04314 [Colletotrichum karsti]|uniref:Zn(2)-C6 fungal-type domain-containing protein n=1 Tax=Colletotrichum karsti TaxID=1095194 RepID=A0A9P6IAN5_9PEZI|nr:uncharacterized protein CkaCkLH20_04314 [Colletotrichum karsti]KAF9878276.1 hypothetical protein CkaCkLH20_04314 [Colletotrichum karsti]
MVRKKRKYVPKVKGCYECSQRRIDCDGTKPSCAKCSTRGIPCSGFGPTYKFLDGFSSRRKSSSSVNRSALLKDALAQSSSDASFRARLNKTQRDAESENIPYDDWDRLYWETSLLDFDDAVQQAALVDACWQMSPCINVNNSACDVVENEEVQNQGETPEVPILPENSGELEEVDETVFSPSTTEALDYKAILRSATPMDLSLLEPWKEFLLTHFSDAIAPQMVVVDDCFNGWRHMILPLAWSNEMVMDAVMAVSAFHISGIISVQSFANPDRLYSRAIKQLLSRKELADWDGETRQMVILAIVVLLVSVMVNGLPDFPIVFQMLESAIEAVGGEDILADGSEMGGFLLRQIRK